MLTLTAPIVNGINNSQKKKTTIEREIRNEKSFLRQVVNKQNSFNASLTQPVLFMHVNLPSICRVTELP